jgi:hypothetical protein
VNQIVGPHYGSGCGTGISYIQNPDFCVTSPCTGSCQHFQTGVASGQDCVWTFRSYSFPSTCPEGSTLNSKNVCIPNNCYKCNDLGFVPPFVDDPSRDLDQYDGDQDGCNNAGGYYFTDHSCNTAGEAIPKVFNNPLATVGAMLTVGGVTFGAGGIVAAAVFGATPVGAVTFGALAIGGGLTSMAVAFGSALAAPSSSSEIVSGEKRMKVSLTTSGGSGGKTPGTNLTQTNTTTNKVEQAVFIPDSVKTAMADSTNVNRDTGELINPISTAGMTVTSYDYETNTATTEYHLPDSTSSTPKTASTTSSFTVSQNIDGTVKTTPTNTAVAPTVSGSTGGVVVAAPSPSIGSSGATSGTSEGDTSGDYMGVLTDIKNNTGESKSFLDELLSMFTPDESFDPEIDNGIDSFGDLKNEATGSFSGFVYDDPLGLNNSSSGTIPTYSFTLMGQTFVLFDQSLFNKLPIDLIKSILLMVAAIAGFITVIVGV